LEHRDIFFGAIDVVLNVECANLIRRREALDLAIGNDAHQDRLSGTVLATETITVTMFKMEIGGVEHHLGTTVGERELTVAEVLILFLIIELRIITRILGRRADHPVASD
jgi:hypothetical protein